MKSMKCAKRSSWVLLLALAAVVFLTTSLTGQIIVTAAGGWVGDGGPATGAGFVLPRFMARDASGNLYISESFGHRIRMVDSSGTITTVVGNGIPGFSGDGGPASAATVYFPAGLAFDAAGNLFIAEQGDGRIRKVDAATGIISTIAGTGTQGYSGDGGPALDADLSAIRPIAVDADGNIFVGDIAYHVVRKINPAGIITTVAGTGVAGYNGDGIPATSATLNSPIELLADGLGNLYISDLLNYRVRKVDTAGIITTFAGTGEGGFSGDGGLATAARIGAPRGLVFDMTGGLLIASNGRHRIRRVDLTTGIITTVAGMNGGFNFDGNDALATRFQAPASIFFDPAGNLIVLDSGNKRVRKVDAVSGTVGTVAGGFLGDGNLATSASLNQPQNLALDAAGNLYVSDAYNYRVRKVDSRGIISTLAGNGINGYTGDGGPATSASINLSYGVVADAGGNVFFYDNTYQTIRQVDPFGTITTFYEAPDYYFYTSSMAIDASSNLYIGDQYYCVVRKIDRLGTMSIVAGTEGLCGYTGDGMRATSAQLIDPNGVAVDSAGNLYIADVENNRIRRVDTAGMISTVAGNGNCDFTGDGGLATAAALCFPYSVAVDAVGNLYIADANNVRIRQVDRAGIIRTIAGTGWQGDTGDGGPPLNATFSFVNAVATNAAGDVYVADSVSRVRKIAFPRSLYLHANNKALTLNYTSPTGKSAKAQNSGTLAFQGGNPWKALGTWNASAALTRGTLYEIKDLHAWLGVAAKQDRKANFDVRAELYKNGVIVASGETRCISGLSEDVNLAREATVSFAPFPNVTWDGTTDVLSLKLLTRVGTTANGSACGGNSKASGLRLLFDAAKRPTQFPVTIP